MPCRRCRSASNASGAFLLPGSQPLSLRHDASSTGGIGGISGIAPTASLLSGLAERLTGLAKPPAASASAQPASSVGPDGCGPGAAAPVKPGKQLALAEGRPPADTADTDGSQKADLPVAVSLTEAGKQQAGQLVVSEVCAS